VDAICDCRLQRFGQIVATIERVGLDGQPHCHGIARWGIQGANTLRTHRLLRACDAHGGCKSHWDHATSPERASQRRSCVRDFHHDFSGRKERFAHPPHVAHATDDWCAISCPAAC
jgi:hypothetical protein